MGDTAKDINMMELLLKISNDVSSIKTDMANFKEAQKLEKENTTRELEDVRCDCKKEITELAEKTGLTEAQVRGALQDKERIRICRNRERP